MPKDHHALAKHRVRIRLLQVPQSADSLTCICTKCQGANRRVISIVRPGGSIPSKKPTSRSSGSTWLSWRDRDGYLMSSMTFYEVRSRSAMENFLISFIIMYCSNFPVDLDRAIHKPRCLQRDPGSVIRVVQRYNQAPSRRGNSCQNLLRTHALLPIQEIYHSSILIVTFPCYFDHLIYLFRSNKNRPVHRGPITT